MHLGGFHINGSFPPHSSRSHPGVAQSESGRSAFGKGSISRWRPLGGGKRTFRQTACPSPSAICARSAATPASFVITW